MSTSFKGWFKKDTVDAVKPIASKLVRKNLSKRLKANQQAGRYIHIMDDDMFNTISQMIKSDDSSNRRMARDIILRSKLNKEQLDYFVTNYFWNLV